MTVTPLTQLVPLIVSFCTFIDPGTGLDDTLLTVGVVAETLKV